MGDKFASALDFNNNNQRAGLEFTEANTMYNETNCFILIEFITEELFTKNTNIAG